jgi:hypothetical protein
MKLFAFIILISLILLFGFLPTAYGQDDDASEPTIEDLEKELDSALKLVKNHFDDVQDRLEEAGSDRDPTVDKAIRELEKEQQDLMATFEGLGSILLEAHTKPGEPCEPKSKTTFEDVEDEFRDAIKEMEKYIAEREAYWEQHESDPDTTLNEELKQLQSEQEFLEKLVAPLAEALKDSWDDVTAGWGDALQEWEDTVRSLAPSEE